MNAYLVPASGQTLRRRLVCAVTAVVAAGAVLGSYALKQAHDTRDVGRYVGLGPRDGAWNLYGRVAPFADCERFHVTGEEAKLCDPRPASQRPGPEFFIFADQHLGGPSGNPAHAREVSDFAKQAILHQPLDYLRAVGRDLLRYGAPEHYNGPGYGLSPTGLIQQSLIASADPPATPATRYYTPGHAIDSGGISLLNGFEQRTRLKGPVFVLLLLLTLAGPLVAPRARLRWAAGYAAVVVVVALMAPVATAFYDARLAVPAFGLLGVGAAVGVGAIAQRRQERRCRT